MTAMSDAMEKAGVQMPEQRLRKLIEAVPVPRTPETVMRAIVASGDVEAALALVDPAIVAARLRAWLKELERAGQFSITDGPADLTRRSDETRPGGHRPVTDGQKADTTGSPVWTPEDIRNAGKVGLTRTTAHGQRVRTRLPGHARQRSKEALATVQATVAKSHFDTVLIRGRAIGDILYGEMERSARLSLNAGIDEVRKAALQNMIFNSVPYNPTLRDRPVREWADETVFDKFEERWNQLAELGLQIPKIAELFGLEKQAA